MDLKFIGNLNFELNHYQKQPLQKLNFIYNNKSYTILPYLDEIHGYAMRILYYKILNLFHINII